MVRGVVEHLYSTRWCAPERGKLAQGPTTTANQDVKPVVFPTQGSGEIPLNAWSEQILSSDKCRLQFVKTGVFELDLEEEKTTNGWLISVRIISGAPEGLGYICR